MARIFSFVLVCLAALSTHAAPAKISLQIPVKIGIRGQSPWISQGALVGGKAGLGYSLQDLIIVPDEKREKWILTFGDYKGETWNGPPVYFQMQLSNDGRRATASLSQVSLIQRADVMPRLAKTSHLLEKLRVIPNRHDQVAYLEFYFKTPVKLRASAESRKDRQLVFEFEKR